MRAAAEAGKGSLCGIGALPGSTQSPARTVPREDRGGSLRKARFGGEPERRHRAIMASMSRIAIFLRGINLGRRRLQKDELMRPFRNAGFAGVDTFIASGNVVIDDPGITTEELEARVEAEVVRAFGFEADAFARSIAKLTELVERDELSAAEAEGFTPHAIFLKKAPGAPVADALTELEGEDDRFPVLGREVLWLRRGRLTDSSIQTRHLERALGGVPNTMRNVRTLRRMVAKYAT
jgi:uncharacterized protein (DUF1697 family)